MIIHLYNHKFLIDNKTDFNIIQTAKNSVKILNFTSKYKKYEKG